MNVDDPGTRLFPGEASLTNDPRHYTNQHEDFGQVRVISRITLSVDYEGPRSAVYGTERSRLSRELFL